MSHFISKITVKELNMKILKLVVPQSNLRNAKSFSEITADNLFVKFITFIRFKMRGNFLAKKK